MKLLASVCVFLSFALFCAVGLAPAARAEVEGPLVYPLDLTGFKTGWVLSYNSELGSNIHEAYTAINTGEFEGTLNFYGAAVFGKVHSTSIPEDWLRPRRYNSQGQLVYIDATTSITFSLTFDIQDDGDLTYFINGQRMFFGYGVPGYPYSYTTDPVISFGAYYDDFSSDDVDLAASYTYVGMSPVKVPEGSTSTSYFKCYVVNSIYNQAGSTLPRLRGLYQLNITFSFTGSPNQRYIDFFWAYGNSVTVQTTNVNEDLQLSVDQMNNKSQQMLDDMTISKPNVNNVSGNLLNQMQQNSSSLSVLRPDYSSTLISFLVSAGVASLSFAFLGYILFGKKG